MDARGVAGRKTMNGYRRKLSSVNRARNCLEPRRGIVTANDVRAGILRIQFEQRVITPSPMEDGSGVGLQQNGTVSVVEGSACCPGAFLDHANWVFPARFVNNLHGKYT